MKSSFNTLWGRIWNGREPFALRLSRGDKYNKTGNYNPGRRTAQQTFRTCSFAGDSLRSGIPLLARFFRIQFFILLILWWMLISAPVSPPLVPKFGAPGPILLLNSRAHPMGQPPLSTTCYQIILGPSDTGDSIHSLNSLTLHTQEANSTWRIELSFTCGFIL